MTEIVFECYGAPSLAYGIDSLFSYRHNEGNTGLVVSSSYSSTHLIPVYNQKPMLAQAIRLNWGGYHAAEYLTKLIKLKYDHFPGKMAPSHTEFMVKDHCYLAKDYDSELASYLDWSGLEDRERVVQYPYTEEIIVQKTEEELAKIAERKKESGRRLQEQAAKMRLDRLLKKEEELEYFKDVQRRLVDQNKKETKRILDDAEMKDEAQLEKTVKNLEHNIKRARQKDLGGPVEEEQVEEPDFSLLEVPDEELDDAGIKAKRQQRLMKSGLEARLRAKAEKEAEAARIAEEARLDEAKRIDDLEGWLEERRQARLETLAKMKDRDRLKQDLGNRKSLASQMRMKQLANLAADNPSGATGRKRRRGGDDDDFGADDADWGVYRNVAVGANKGDSDDEEEQEENLDVTIRNLEEDLLKYDPEFTYEHTVEAQNNWTKSLLHAWRYGPRPVDEGSQAERNQIHLNVERIRVPEVVFQPSALAGVDQAGLVEIAGDILTQRLTAIPGIDRDDFLKDIFLTGGATLFENFDERMRSGLRPLLPDGAPLTVRRAKDALLDAWRGAAGWAGGEEWKRAKISREEYLEKGSEWFKVCVPPQPSSTLLIATTQKAKTSHHHRSTTWETRLPRRLITTTRRRLARPTRGGAGSALRSVPLRQKISPLGHDAGQARKNRDIRATGVCRVRTVLRRGPSVTTCGRRIGSRVAGCSRSSSMHGGQYGGYGGNGAAEEQEEGEEEGKAEEGKEDEEEEL